MPRQSNSRRTKLDAPRQIIVFVVFKFNFSQDETAPLQLKGDIFLCIPDPITKWKICVLPFLSNKRSGMIFHDAVSPFPKKAYLHSCKFTSGQIPFSSTKHFKADDPSYTFSFCERPRHKCFRAKKRGTFSYASSAAQFPLNFF